MARIIDPTIKELLLDKHWLNDKHVIQLFSISELSKQLKVTPGSIRKYLRIHQIISPSQQQLRAASNQRKYGQGVTNPGSQIKANRDKTKQTMKAKFGGHVWSHEGNRNKRNNTCLTLYGSINTGNVDSLTQKGRISKLGQQNYDLLTNIEQLNQLYISQNMSIQQISELLDVSWTTIQQALNQCQISITRSNLHHDIQQDLQNTELLTNWHHNLYYNMVDIGVLLKCDHQTIQKAFDKLNITTRIYSSHLSPFQRQCLYNKKWVENHLKYDSLQQACTDINVTMSILYSYINKHQLKLSKKHFKLTNAHQLLNNSEWLHQQHVIDQKTLSQISEQLGVKGGTPLISQYLKQHNIPLQQFQISQQEKQIREMLISIDPNIVMQCNDTSMISPFELDIFLPAHNIAIEYCGLYWHSEIHKKSSYHLDKLKLCSDRGIRLITIFEDEWVYKREQICSKITNILQYNSNKRIFARQCQIVEVNLKQKKVFLDKYHIQGFGSGSITYGLTHKGVLVSVFTVINKGNNRYDINRFASSIRIVGGFSKLLTHFKKQYYDWKFIQSFADLRWCDPVNNMYGVNGFTMVKQLSPDYRYINKDKREHKFNFRHKSLAIKLEKYDNSLTEVQNCHNHGLFRIWDCGLLKYEINNIK